MTEPGRRASAHFYPVDLVRVLTFGCVIAVHTLSVTNPLESVPAGAPVMLLHFTREAFFVLTAFVLTHRHRSAAPRPLPFWRRRLLLVGVPYVAWTAIYTAIGLSAAPRPVPEAVLLLGRNLLTGAAWFHLYFLLVSMQFYLLFPLFRAGLRVAARRPWAVLAASVALQVLIDLYLHDPAPTGVTAALLPYAGSIVVSYQLFFVVGGLAAVHLGRLESWTRARPRTVAAGVLVTAALAEGSYWWSIARGEGAVFATDVFQPVMIPWSVALVLGFFALGLRWADRRGDGPRSRLVERAADRSFGVFLVHPFILWLLTAGGAAAPAMWLPLPWSSVAAYVVATLGSLVLVEGLRLTPLSLPLTGKSWAPPPFLAATRGRAVSTGTAPARSRAAEGSPGPGTARGD
ncbi:MAG TPA: acyltransferase [Pseudonocardia sp.]